MEDQALSLARLLNWPILSLASDGHLRLAPSFQAGPANHYSFPCQWLYSGTKSHAAPLSRTHWLCSLLSNKTQREATFVHGAEATLAIWLKTGLKVLKRLKKSYNALKCNNFFKAIFKQILNQMTFLWCLLSIYFQLWRSHTLKRSFIDWPNHIWCTI